MLIITQRLNTYLLIAILMVLAACEAKVTVNSRQPAETEDPAATEEEASIETSAAKLTADDCIDPDLALVSNTQTLMLCNGKVMRGKLDLSFLSAANVKAGVSIAGVTGTYTGGSYTTCTSDGLTITHNSCDHCHLVV